jgi:hypothetical protein
VNSSPKCGYGSLAIKGPLVAATASWPTRLRGV